MLRGTEIVYIKFVLKFFKIKTLLWSLFLSLCQRSNSGNYVVNADTAERSDSLNHKLYNGKQLPY